MLAPRHPVLADAVARGGLDAELVMVVCEALRRLTDAGHEAPEVGVTAPRST